MLPVKRQLMLRNILLSLILLYNPLTVHSNSSSPPELSLRQCEHIRIEMCRGIGYNETSMPNLVGHELQTDVEYTLQTFAPLIEYDCSSQLKLFLCAAYVPMCTPKAPVHAIGPCRSLCESVRMRCHPVLQGFGFPWPPALDCDRFPKENNHETMCMEGPGEMHTPVQEQELYGINMGIIPVAGGSKLPNQLATLDCAGLAKAHLYIKLHRSGRCAPLCEADILFTPNEKHLSEIWVSTWAYSALGLACVATLCLLLCDDSNTSAKWSCLLSPLVWCHDMVTIGWTVRFIVGRTGTACGSDPQLPNESLLMVDGLSNAACASVFLLRYYFGMAACAWWAALCLGWHREIRRNSPDTKGHIALQGSSPQARRNAKAAAQQNLTRNNFACFIAWGLPAFQTAAVIVARLVDADELIGACYVGNQSDKALQVLVATPVFCYWIFGSMNLISGYLVHCRNKEIMRTTNSLSFQQQLQLSTSQSATNGIGIFLFIYGSACAILLLAVIYEFANIDVWLSSRETNTPLWPYLTRAFLELLLGICCFAWVLGPSISNTYKQKISNRTQKHTSPSTTTEHQRSLHHYEGQGSSLPYHAACSNSTVVSYQTLRLPHQSSIMVAGNPYKHKKAASISLNQMSNYSLGRSMHASNNSNTAHHAVSSHRLCYPAANGYASQKYSNANYYPQMQRYGNETLL